MYEESGRLIREGIASTFASALRRIVTLHPPLSFLALILAPPLALLLIY